MGCTTSSDLKEPVESPLVHPQKADKTATGGSGSSPAPEASPAPAATKSHQATQGKQANPSSSTALPPQEVVLPQSLADNVGASRFRIVLIGNGDAGKSTLFKAMMGDKLSLTKEEMFENIKLHIFEGLHRLLQQVESFGPIKSSSSSYYQELIRNQTPSAITIDHLQYYYQLWLDPVIQSLWQNRNVTDAVDSLAYSLEQLPRYMQMIKKENFKRLNDLDYLHCSIRTVGNPSFDLRYQNYQVTVMDSGGQRSERKKWTKLRDDTTVFVFVASLSEYDQHSYEDDDENRLTASLRSFENLAKRASFCDACLALVFTKADILEDKIHLRSLSDFHPQYSGPEHSFEDAKDWIKQQYYNIWLKYNTLPEHMVNVYEIIATDPSQGQQLLKDLMTICVTTMESGAGGGAPRSGQQPHSESGSD